LRSRSNRSIKAYWELLRPASLELYYKHQGKIKQICKLNPTDISIIEPYQDIEQQTMSSNLKRIVNIGAMRKRTRLDEVGIIISFNNSFKASAKGWPNPL
jgi:hypothetical protein